MYAGFIKTTQPYLVFAIPAFYQAVYVKNGISHFYTFQASDTKEVTIVPSGCMEWVFCYTPNHEYTIGKYNDNEIVQSNNIENMRFNAQDEYSMHGLVFGPSIHQSTWCLQKDAIYLGVRFENGYLPKFIDMPRKKLIGNRFSFQDLVCELPFLQNLSMTGNFTEQVHRFLEIYNTVYETKDFVFSKHAMVNTCKRMIYDSNGFIRIEKIAEKLGYTERYLNKLFTDEIGCAAKTLCKVVRFQALLTHFHHACFTNNMGKVKMIEIALELGFYDQAQMNKEFKSLAGMTPRQYVNLLETNNYMARIHDIPYGIHYDVPHDVSLAEKKSSSHAISL